MTRFFTALIAIGMTTLAWAAEPKAAPEGTPELKSLKDKAGYSIGLSIGRNLKQQNFDLDLATIVAGITDALSGAESQLSNEEIQETMKEFEQEHLAKQADRAKSAGEKNRKDGSAFFASNGKKPGVVTTKSGLQYKVLKEGKGKKPAKTDTVTTHYRGTLLDGTEFDSSIKRGEPAQFPVNRVIPGWTEALQLMPVGSKWQLFVPAELAYGAQGAGPDIGPNSTLVFEVELLGVGDKKPADAEELEN